MLNQDIFGNRAIDWYSDTLEEELNEYAREVKGEFVPVEYDGNLFPPGLVAIMEKELYQLEKTDGEVDDTWYDPWYEVLDTFGAGDFILGLDDLYQLFPELNVYRDEFETVYDAYRCIMPDTIDGIEGYCMEVFHFSMEPGRDHYIFLYQAGGTAKDYIVKLTEKSGGEFVAIDGFETQNYGGGRVIQYGDAFYYVFLQRNQNLYNVDGIRIRRWTLNNSWAEKPDIGKNLWVVCLYQAFLCRFDASLMHLSDTMILKDVLYKRSEKAF